MAPVSHLRRCGGPYGVGHFCIFESHIGKEKVHFKFLNGNSRPAGSDNQSKNAFSQTTNGDIFESDKNVSSNTHSHYLKFSTSSHPFFKQVKSMQYGGSEVSCSVGTRTAAKPFKPTSRFTCASLILLHRDLRIWNRNWARWWHPP